MVAVLTQQDIPPQGGSDVFASDPEAGKAIPGSPYYTNGVEVRYTAPEPWWNWFWNIITSWLKHHKEDNQALITEETNLLAAANITPDDSNAHQVGESIRTIGFDCAEAYDNQTTTEGGTEHFVNKPYVVGGTIILPDTELL